MPYQTVLTDWFLLLGLLHVSDNTLVMITLAFGQNDTSVNPSVMMNNLTTLFVTPGGKWGMNTHCIALASDKEKIIR